jgi:hypothetical protein
MSTPQAILQQLHNLGARIEYREGRLALRAGQRPVPELLVEQARTAKAELMMLLSAENAPNTPKALTTTLDEHLQEKRLKNAPESRGNPSSTEGAHHDEHLRRDSPENEHLREHLQQTPEGAHHMSIFARASIPAALRLLRRRRCSSVLVVRAFAIFRPRSTPKPRVGLQALRPLCVPRKNGMKASLSCIRITRRSTCRRGVGCTSSMMLAGSSPTTRSRML